MVRRVKPVLAEGDLLRSPAWFPLRIAESGEMSMVYLDEAAYRAASFLDERILVLPCEQSACGLDIIRTAAARLTPQSHYIFHTGHVGSTLISRLVGAHEGFFSLREPALLRVFAGEPGRRGAAGATFDPVAGRDGQLRLGAALALFSRTWRPNQRAVIKTTSIVNELAELMLAGVHHPAAIFVFAHPLTYMRGIFAGPNSRVESKMLAPARMARLVRRLGGGHAEWQLDPRSEGEHIAMSWLCEMTALHQAAVRHPSQVLWVNFDTFLREPPSGLQAIFRSLGKTPAAGEIEALVTGPLMRQYSKAPEYAYDAALRQSVLLSADPEHGAEIRRAMDWLGRMARRYPSVAAVLELSRIG